MSSRTWLILLVVAALAIWLSIHALDSPAPAFPIRDERPASAPPAPSSEPPASAAPSRPASRAAVNRVEQPGTRIAGRVASRASAEPVADCRVVLAASALAAVIQEAKSSGDGGFALAPSGLDPEAVADSWLVAVHPSYRVFASPVRDVPKAPDGALDVRLEPRLEVAGSARRADGTPVSGARVRLTRQNWDEAVAARHPFPAFLQGDPPRAEYVARTDASGTFSITGVAPGRYGMNLTARGLLRRSGRNEVVDWTTYLMVPPSKTDLHLVLETFDYVALRPVDARTKDPIRSAKPGSQPGHVQPAESQPDAFGEVIGAERFAALGAGGVFVWLVDPSHRGGRLDFGFSADGYRDRVFTATAEKLPDPSLWPVEPRVTDVPLEPEPLRKPVAVAVEVSGPPWTHYFRSVGLLFYEKPSALNPTPRFLRVVSVSLRDRRGTVDLHPGKYMIQNEPGFQRVKPVMQFEVKPEGENVLRLDADDSGALLRIRGTSPADVKMPLSHAVLREEGKPDTEFDLASGKPDPDDPYAILLLAPLNKAMRLELWASAGPCGRGFAKLGPLSSGLTTVQEVDVPLEWRFP